MMVTNHCARRRPSLSYPLALFAATLLACGSGSSDGAPAPGAGGGADGGVTPGPEPRGDGGGAADAGDGSSPISPAPDGGVGPFGGVWISVDHPDYQWSSLPAANVPWKHISQLNIGALWPMPAASGFTLGQSNFGTGKPDPIASSWSAGAKEYAAAAHAAGVKVTCLLGGAGGNPNPTGQSGKDYFALATATDADALTFATNVKNVLQPLGIDGVDLDWEDGSATPQIMYAGLVRLAHQIRVAWPTAWIVIPTGSQGTDAASLAAAQADVDAFEPMTYMDVPQWGGWTIPLPLSPLYGADYSLDGTVQKWLAAGVPSSKITIGAGGYGAVWGDSNGDHRAPNSLRANAGSPNSNPEGERAALCDDNRITQAWLDKTLALHPTFTEGWDEATKSSFWSAPSPTSLVAVTDPCGSGKSVEIGLILYETPRSIVEKAKYVQSKSLKGIGFWTLAELLDGASAPVLEAVK